MAKTWATKCCPGTYKNNYQLCCGIKDNIPPYAYNVCKVFVLCEIESGYFRPNIEADESAYFGLEELPILAKEKNNEEQIKMCFSAYYDRNWQVLFD